MNVKKIINNRKIRIVFALSAAFWMAAFTQAAITKYMSPERNITEAFATSDDIKISGCTIDVTAKLAYDKAELSEKGEQLLKSVDGAAGSGSECCNNISFNENMYKLDYESDKYSLNCAAVWSEELQHTYFHCVVKLKQSMSECQKIQNNIEDILNRYESEYISYIKIDAFKEGKSNIKSCRKYASDIFGRLGAVPVSAAQDTVYTEYGYSKDIERGIMDNNNKVNVQISFTYNELKNVTEICVGTPVINVSY